MNYLAKLVVAGMMGLLLAACGEEAPKPAADQAAPAVEQAAPAAEQAAPAAEQAAPADAEPTDEQKDGATKPE